MEQWAHGFWGILGHWIARSGGSQDSSEEGEESHESRKGDEGLKKNMMGNDGISSRHAGSKNDEKSFRMCPKEGTEMKAYAMEKHAVMRPLKERICARTSSGCFECLARGRFPSGLGWNHTFSLMHCVYY